jgi:hypothetical protein
MTRGDDGGPECRLVFLAKSASKGAGKPQFSHAITGLFLHHCCLTGVQVNDTSRSSVGVTLEDDQFPRLEAVDQCGGVGRDNDLGSLRRFAQSLNDPV